MKFLVDMNLSPKWVAFLAEAGFQAIHWSNVGSCDASDSELMLWAAEHHYIVLTSDLDFGAILAATQSVRPSVMQLRSEILVPDGIGEVVLVAIRQARQELASGALVSVDTDRARIRVLPFAD